MNAHTSRPFSDDLATFARFPLVQLVGYLVAAALGGLLALHGSTAELVVTCGSRVMAAADTCLQRGRRGARFENSYQEMARHAERGLTGQTVGGVLVVVAALLLVVALLRSWRRDAGMVDTLRSEQPEASMVDRTLVMGLIGAAIGLFVLGLGGYLTFRLRGVSEDGSVIGTIIGVVVTLVGVLIVALVQPRGASLTMVHPDRLTVAAFGSIHRVGWQQVQLRLQKSSIALTFSDTTIPPVDSNRPSPDFVRLVEQRSAHAVLEAATAELAAGRQFSFGDVVVHPTGLTLGGSYTTFGDLVGLRLDGSAYVVQRADGAPGAQAMLLKVYNVAALRLLLQQQFGLMLP